VPGKPSLYGTTKVFLEYLSGLSELPSLSELRDLEEIGKELNLSLNLEQASDKKEVNDQAQDEKPAKMLAPEQGLVEDEIDQPIEAKVGQLNQ